MSSSTGLVVAGTNGPSPTSIQQADPTYSLKQALRNFQNILTEEQKRQFQAQYNKPDASSVIAFVATLDASNAIKARRCVAPRLCTFLNATQQFVGVVDTFVQSHPEIAALVWGSVKLAITSASNVASYFEKVTNLIMTIGRSCPTYEQFGLLYPGDVDLQRVLSDYYAIIIRLCIKIVEISKRSSVKRTLIPIYSPFETEFKDILLESEQVGKSILLQLAHASAKADQEAKHLLEFESKENSSFRRSVAKFNRDSETERAEASEWRMRKLARETAKLRSNIKRNLCTIDHGRPWKQAMRLRTPETAEWLYQDQTFQDWKSDPSTAIMFCSGKLGVGKTVLVSNTVAQLHLSKGPDDVVAYYFCRSDHEASLTARNILGSIASQFLNKQIEKAGRQDLEDLQCRTQSADTEDIIELLLSNLEPTNTHYLVVDGLDECDSGEIRLVAKGLSQLIDKQAKGLKILIAGRPDLVAWLSGTIEPKYEISMTGQKISSDITKYIATTLDNCLADGQIQLGDQSLRKDILEAVSKGCDEMILWVQLVIDDLRTQNSDKQIRNCLLKLPHGLFNLYNRKLDRIKRQSADDQATKMLQFCGVSKRPLTVSEYQEALSVSPGQQSFDRSKLPNNMELLLRNCCGLLFVDEEEDTLHYVHHSLKKHFFEAQNPNKAYFDLQETDLDLGHLCMTYLNFVDFQRQLTKVESHPMAFVDPIQFGLLPTAGSSLTSNFFLRPLISRHRRLSRLNVRKLPEQAQNIVSNTQPSESRPFDQSQNYRFLDYAGSAWIYHVSQLKPESNNHIWSLFCRCVGTESIPADRPWVPGQRSLENQVKFGQTPVSGLGKWIVANNHCALLECLSKLGSNSIPVTARSQILSEASDEQYAHFAELVLELDDNSYEVLELGLKRAEERCDQEYVISFLKAAKQKKHQLATLVSAATTGRIYVVEGLLCTGDDVNVTDNDGYAALHFAAMNGHIQAVERLLSAGAAVDVRDNYGRTALHLAARFGHMQVVERLLSAGATVDVRDKYGDTALHYAARYGHIQVVERLLSAGAADDVRGHDGNTALHFAAMNGHIQAVERLLSAGAAVDVRDNYGRTALHLAARFGHMQVVERLMSAGAAVDVRDYKDWTALHYAARYGHIQVVEGLLLAGADAKIRNWRGSTAREFARKIGNSNIVALLKQAEAK